MGMDHFIHSFYRDRMTGTMSGLLSLMALSLFPFAECTDCQLKCQHINPEICYKSGVGELVPDECGCMICAAAEGEVCSKTGKDERFDFHRRCATGLECQHDYYANSYEVKKCRRKDDSVIDCGPKNIDLEDDLKSLMSMTMKVMEGLKKIKAENSRCSSFPSPSPVPWASHN